MISLLKALKYILIFFAGLLTGGVIGVLLAPKSGKEMRDDIVSKSNEFTNLTKKELAKIHEMGYSRIESLTKSISNKREDNTRLNGQSEISRIA